MSIPTPGRQATLAVSLGAVAAIEGVVFLIAGLSHTGMRILPFDEPRIVDATVVEGLCGVLLVGSAVSVFARAAWAWLALVIAHAFTLVGVIVGIAAIAAGLGPHSVFNDGFHRVMVVVLPIVLIMLVTPPVRVALRNWSEGEQHASSHSI
jgi:hypothetical protein